jgi:xylan 1,4-beta-xylosidase
MYDHATAAIREVLPRAKVGPGNFLLRPQGERRQDAMKIMKHLASGKNYATGKTGSPVDFLAISLYYAPSGKAIERAKTPQAKRNILNAHSHESARTAARRLKPLRNLSPRFKDVPLEIHEFGVLSSELYRGSGPRKGNRGAREGAWVLQTYAVALDEGFRDIFSWPRRDTTFGKAKPLLSPSAWLRGMLDLGEGGSWYILDRKLATKNESSAMALASVKKDAAYVFCSVYNLYRKNDADEELRIELDRSLLPFAPGKKVTVREYLQDKGNNVMDRIHRDLKAKGMIKKDRDDGEVYAPRVCATLPGVVHLKKHAEKYVKMFTDSYNAQPFKGKAEDKGGTIVLTRRVKTPSVLVLEVTAK